MSTLIAGTYTGSFTKVASAVLAGYSTPVANGVDIRSSLFTNGEKGVWFDPSDFSTLFQDSTGTTPVTAVGQPVGKILDKSGNGFHATQATTTKRPLLQQDATGRYYLKFDGVDDFLVTPSIDFSATDKMSVFAGVRKLSDAAVEMIVELSAAWTSNNGSFSLYNNALPATDLVSASRGNATTTVYQTSTASPYVAPVTMVISTIHDIAGSTTSLWVNTLAATTATGPKGTGNFGNYPLYIGMRGAATLPFNGQLYSLVVRGALSNANQIAASETYVNSKTGAY